MKKKKGISLIVLIVTIIVIIILAATVILTITKNNPIESSKEAVFKEDVRAFQDELNMYISNEYTRLQGQRDIKITAKGYGKDGEKDSVYTYIPDFKKKYEGKLAIKEDMIAYVGTDEKEKEWLLNSGVYIAKTLTVKYVDQDGNKLKEDESIPLMDNYYSVDVPEIEGYIRFSEKLEGKISQDIEVIAEYYLENDNLAYIGLDASGKETTDEASIVSYKVTGIGECNVSKIAIPREHNGKPVTKIKENAFRGNALLAGVIIGNNIEKIGDFAFGDCYNITLASVNSYSLGTSVFVGNNKLQTAIIGENVSNCNYGLFAGCAKLEKVTILSNNLNINNSILGNGTSLKEIKLSEDNNKYKFEDGILYSYDETVICSYLPGNLADTYTVPSTIKRIGGFAFCNCHNLKYINIPDTVEKVENCAFRYCTRLEEVNINAVSLGTEVFRDDYKLKKFTIGNSVKNWNSHIVAGCNNLTSLTYFGTIEEWNNTLGKSNTWKIGNSSTTKIICSDGDITL